MKFDRVKMDRIDIPGRVKVKYSESDDNNFAIVSDEFGVVIDGELFFESNDDLQTFAKALSDAWKDHANLRKSIQNEILAKAH